RPGNVLRRPLPPFVGRLRAHRRGAGPARRRGGQRPPRRRRLKPGRPARDRPLASPVVSERTYRVIVRGVFDGLDDAQRTRLRAEAAAHDLLVSSFTEEGTLSYDERLAAFSHRVLVRVEAGSGEEGDAHAAGELAAITYLDAAGLGYRNLRSSVT